MSIWKDSKTKLNKRKHIKWLTEVKSSKRDPKKERTSPVFGPKMQIINAFEQNKNIEDAYNLAEEINKKIGKEIYSKKIVDSWIAEEVRKKENKKDRNRDENDDAR